MRRLYFQRRRKGGNMRGNMVGKAWEILTESKEESLVGLLVGVAFIGSLKWGVLITAPIVMFLWRFGGYQGTSLGWRRVGVPTVICLTAAIINNAWVPLLSWPLMFGALTIGYGLPGQHDNGSPLARFLCRILDLQPECFEEERNAADIATRCVFGGAIGLSGIFLTQDPVAGALATGLLMCGVPAVVISVE
jgi:hypothetical protein